MTESDKTVPRAQAEETWQEPAEVHDGPGPVLVPGGPGRYVVCGWGRTVGGERVVDLREAARELLAAEEAYRLAPTLERTSALARARRRVEEVLATDAADDPVGAGRRGRVNGRQVPPVVRRDSSRPRCTPALKLVRKL